MVVPLFGWSAGDVISGAKALYKIGEAFSETQGAEAQYTEAATFLECFATDRQRARDLVFSHPKSKYTPDVRVKLDLVDKAYQAFEKHQDDYKELDATLTATGAKRRDMIKKQSKKIKWAIEQMSGRLHRLQDEVAQPLASIHVYYLQLLLDEVTALHEAAVKQKDEMLQLEISFPSSASNTGNRMSEKLEATLQSLKQQTKAFKVAQELAAPKADPTPDQLVAVVSSEKCIKDQTAKLWTERAEIRAAHAMSSRSMTDMVKALSAIEKSLRQWESRGRKLEAVAMLTAASTVALLATKLLTFIKTVDLGQKEPWNAGVRILNPLGNYEDVPNQVTEIRMKKIQQIRESFVPERGISRRVLDHKLPAFFGPDARIERRLQLPNGEIGWFVSGGRVTEAIIEDLRKLTHRLEQCKKSERSLLIDTDPVASSSMEDQDSDSFTTSVAGAPYVDSMAQAWSTAVRGRQTTTGSGNGRRGDVYDDLRSPLDNDESHYEEHDWAGSFLAHGSPISHSPPPPPQRSALYAKLGVEALDKSRSLSAFHGHRDDNEKNQRLRPTLHSESTSRLCSLGRAFVAVNVGNYTGLEKFIIQNPNVVELEKSDLLKEAQAALLDGKDAYASCCVQQLLLLRKLGDLSRGNRRTFFERLIRRDRTAIRDFLSDRDVAIGRLRESISATTRRPSTQVSDPSVDIVGTRAPILSRRRSGTLKPRKLHLDMVPPQEDLAHKTSRQTRDGLLSKLSVYCGCNIEAATEDDKCQRKTCSRCGRPFDPVDHSDARRLPQIGELPQMAFTNQTALSGLMSANITNTSEFCQDGDRSLMIEGRKPKRDSSKSSQARGKSGHKHNDSELDREP